MNSKNFLLGVMSVSVLFAGCDSLNTVMSTTAENTVAATVTWKRSGNAQLPPPVRPTKATDVGGTVNYPGAYRYSIQGFSISDTTLNTYGNGVGWGSASSKQKLRSIKSIDYLGAVKVDSIGKLYAIKLNTSSTGNNGSTTLLANAPADIHDVGGSGKGARAYWVTAGAADAAGNYAVYSSLDSGKTWQLKVGARGIRIDGTRANALLMQADGTMLSWDMFTPLTWSTMPEKALDITVGGDASKWRVGTDNVVYKWVSGAWQSYPGILATKIACENGNPWVVSKTDGYVWYF